MHSGSDHVTGRRHYRRKTIRPGPTAARDAECAKVCMFNEVDEQRTSHTGATVDALVDDYLERLNIDTTTRMSYEGYIRNHIRRRRS